MRGLPAHPYTVPDTPRYSHAGHANKIFGEPTTISGARILPRHQHCRGSPFGPTIGLVLQHHIMMLEYKVNISLDQSLVHRLFLPRDVVLHRPHTAQLSRRIS